MSVEVVAFLAACVAALGLFLAVRHAGADGALWLASWPALLLTSATIVGQERYPALQLVEHFLGPWFPALQLAGTYQFLERPIPRRLLPATLAAGCALTALVALERSTPRYAASIAFDTVVLGLAVVLIWPPVIRSRYSPRDAGRFAIALSLAALLALDVVNDLHDMRSSDDTSPLWSAWAIVSLALFSTQLGAVVAQSTAKARDSLLAARRDSAKVVIGGVAHDFNNLLTVITGFASIAEHELADGRREAAKDALGEVQLAVVRAARITRRLLEHVEAVPQRVERVDVGELLERIALRLRLAHGAGPSLHVSVTDDHPAILGDRSLLQTAIELLIENALESGGAPPVRVTASTVHFHERVLGDGDTRVEPGDFVSISVEDSGAGIPEAMHAHVFEPFFTTREMGRGLGLAAVAGIARALGGLVRLERSSERGTTMRLCFPMHPQRPPASTLS